MVILPQGKDILTIREFLFCLTWIAIFMQFKSICFFLNPRGLGKQLSRAAVSMLRMVTSQSSIPFIFLSNKCHFLQGPVPSISLVFFPYKQSLPLPFNTYRFLIASPSPFLPFPQAFLFLLL